MDGATIAILFSAIYLAPTLSKRAGLLMAVVFAVLWAILRFGK